MPMQLKVECDNCGRSALRFTYWQCRDCGSIACDNCADEKGTQLGMQAIEQTDGLLATLGKGFVAGVLRACPNCNSVKMTIIFKPN